MRTFTLELDFNELTGESRIIVDFNDNSMSAFEINESISNGEMLDEILEKAAVIFGKQIAQDVRDGKIEAICLDNHPELRNNDTDILINTETDTRQKIEQ